MTNYTHSLIFVNLTIIFFKLDNSPSYYRDNNATCCK